ncbi:MAG: lipase family protein [Rubrivivax sp.]
MTVHSLSPSQAASIANGVYALQERSVDQVRERNAPMSSEDPVLSDESGFSGTGADRFEGRSGNIFYSELTGFGYVARGNGARAGEMLIATRGTATVADALTDLNFALVSGPSGRLVHSGFMSTWNSYTRQLERALEGPAPTRIHCVGHSLGGALAMLNAEYLAQRGIAEVLVYTFGAPRVGDWFHRQAFVSAIGNSRTFRVYNVADPVPMIPLFPFFHVEGMAIDTGAGLIAPSAHRMAATYAPAVAGKGWSDLRSASAQRQRAIESQAEYDHALAMAMLAPMGSGAALLIIGRALRWLVGRALLVVGGSLLAATATVLDRLAWLVSEGIARCRELAEQARGLFSAVMRFLGRAAVSVGEMGVAFVRWVLEMLWTHMRSLAVRAIRMASRRI